MKIKLNCEVVEQLQAKAPELVAGLSDEAKASLVVNLFRRVYDEEGRKAQNRDYYHAHKMVEVIPQETVESAIDFLLKQEKVDDLYFMTKIIQNNNYDANLMVKCAEIVAQALEKRAEAVYIDQLFYVDKRSLDSLFIESGRFVKRLGEVFKDVTVDVVQPKKNAPKELLARIGEMYDIASWYADKDKKEMLEDKALVSLIKAGSFKKAAEILDRKKGGINPERPFVGIVYLMREASCYAAAGEFESAGYTAEELIASIGWRGFSDVKDDLTAEYAMRASEYFVKAGKKDNARHILWQHSRCIERQTGIKGEELFQKGLESCETDEDRVLYASLFRKYKTAIDWAGNDSFLKARVAFKLGVMDDAVIYLNESGEIQGAARLARKYEEMYKDLVDFSVDQVEEKKQSDAEGKQFWKSSADLQKELEENTAKHKFFSEKASGLYNTAVQDRINQGNYEDAEQIARESMDYDLIADVKALRGELSQPYHLFASALKDSRTIEADDAKALIEKLVEDSIDHSDFGTAYVAAKLLGLEEKANEYAFLNRAFQETREDRDFSQYSLNHNAMKKGAE